MQRTLAKTTSLQRLHIAMDITRYAGRLPRMFPSTLKHLEVPILWLTKVAFNPMEHRDVLAGLDTVRVRGILRSANLLTLLNREPDLLLVAVETYSTNQFSDLGVLMSMVLLPFEPTWKPYPLKVITRPSLCLELKRAVTYYGSTYGSMHEDKMVILTVSSQKLDEASQLSIWLAE